MQDILQAFEKMLQTDIVILNFSKAFDTVLLQYWTTWTLMGKQTDGYGVLVDEVLTKAVSVELEVPKGSVLGPLLFLCDINDLLSSALTS